MKPLGYSANNGYNFWGTVINALPYYFSSPLRHMAYEGTAKATKNIYKTKKKLRLQQTDWQVYSLLHPVGLALLRVRQRLLPDALSGP